MGENTPVVQPAFSLGATIFFWVIAVLTVALAIGIAICRKAVHSAVCMVGVMLCLAMLYVSQGAYFIGVVQVVVYTGAVMTLILFIIMMVGINASDNYLRTSRSLRRIAWLMGVGGAVILVGVICSSILPDTGKVAPVDTGLGTTTLNPVQVAIVLFRDHIFTMQIVAGLLIIAAIGAMSLTHAESMRKLMKQPETAELRMLDYGQRETHPGQRPAPGVYQETNAADVPAVDGEHNRALIDSVPTALRSRNAGQNLAQVSERTVHALRADNSDNPENGLLSLAASQSVKRSGAWGMAGAKADFGLQSPRTKVIKPQMEEVAVTDTNTNEKEGEN